MCLDKNLRQYHYIIDNISVNYKEQIVIIGIKLGI